MLVNLLYVSHLNRSTVFFLNIFFLAYKSLVRKKWQGNFDNRWSSKQLLLVCLSIWWTFLQAYAIYPYLYWEEEACFCGGKKTNTAFTFFFRRKRPKGNSACCCEKMMNCCQQSLFAPLLFLALLLPACLVIKTEERRPYPS